MIYEADFHTQGAYNASQRRDIDSLAERQQQQQGSRRAEGPAAAAAKTGVGPAGGQSSSSRKGSAEGKKGRAAAAKGQRGQKTREQQHQKGSRICPCDVNLTSERSKDNAHMTESCHVMVMGAHLLSQATGSFCTEISTVR